MPFDAIVDKQDCLSCHACTSYVNRPVHHKNVPVTVANIFVLKLINAVHGQVHPKSANPAILQRAAQVIGDRALARIEGVLRP